MQMQEHTLVAAPMPSASAYDNAWKEVLAAPCGAELEYHQGILVKDRQRDPTIDGWAQGFFDAAAKGHGILIQRRLGEGAVCYIFRRSCGS